MASEAFTYWLKQEKKNPANTCPYIHKTGILETKVKCGVMIERWL